MYRTRYDIIRDILKVAKDGTHKTRIVYKANLNFEIIDGYLDILTEKGLVTRDNGTIKTTERGKRYLETFRTLQFIMLGVA